MSINFNITGTSFETNKEVNAAMTDFLDRYWSLSIWSSIVYVIAIFSGVKLMEKHTRFGLSKTLALWSGFLALFSILGTIRMVPNLYYALRYQSFHDSVCTSQWTEVEVVVFWTTLFSLSKIIELGDTVFIVLRKTPLIFLHWYHHITVLVYTWYSYADRTSSGRWFITMNYAVHSVMYAYYALRALKYNAPQWVKMGITLFQLSQMVVGVFIGVYVYRLKQAGIPCGVTDNNMYLSFIMYFSYFLLFMKFFYDAYLKPKKRSPKPVSAAHANGQTKHENGVTANGHLSNGHAANGAATNGHMANGASKKHL